MAPLLALPIVALTGVVGERAGVVGRVAAIYGVILFGLRALGKREVGQLSPLELVTLMLIPEIASSALTGGDDSLPTAIIGIYTLLSLVFVSSVLIYRFRPVGRVVEGDATILVQDGRFRLDALHEERIQPDEVYASMHEQGIEHLNDVRWGILEADGKITFIERKS